MLRRALPLCLALTLLWVVTAAHADERSAPQSLADRLVAAVEPGRDPLDLAVRLRGLSMLLPMVPSVTPPPRVAGDSENFWILDQRAARLFQTQATLRLVTDHAYWFVESDLADRVPQPELVRSAGVFESHTYPIVHRYFGSEPSPGIDGDTRIVFLLANVPGVAAYFSSADAYPRAVNPRSNVHDMIYVNLNMLRPGMPSFDSTITHEFQHMTNFAHCPTQEGWLDEGASELAIRVAGYDSAPPAAFAAHPDVQLTTWTNHPSELTRHYQAAYLFLRYLAERAGGWDALPDILEPCARGENLITAYLNKNPIAPDVETLFSDWTVANLVQDPAVADGRFAYTTGGFRVALTGRASTRAPFLGSVPQYAANYVDLPSIAGTATFSGDPLVPLVPAAIDSAGAWWSNRGDSLDSRLTRSLDLTGVDEATLRFSAWYDVEAQFDFVYLSASRDGGRTWQVLHGQHTLPDKSVGNNYGEGWTGSTGSDWVNEEVDLTPFAGANIRLRFEYVTDQSYNGAGFAFRDLRVPQIGLDEAGAVDDAWTAEGWVRVDGPIPQRWNLRLVRWQPGGISVDSVPVAADGSAAVPLSDQATRTTLVIAPTAPRTLASANYSIAIPPEPAADPLPAGFRSTSTSVTASIS